MPIPTRSLSLREPTRFSQRQVGKGAVIYLSGKYDDSYYVACTTPQSPTREHAPAASRLKPRTTSTTGTGSGTGTTTTTTTANIGGDNGIGRRVGQFHKRSESVSSTSTSSMSIGRERDRENVSPQRRSLLPQKSGLRKDTGLHVPERSQTQSQSKSKPQLQQQAQPTQQQDSRLRLQRHRNAPSISSQRSSLARPGESNAPSTPSVATPTETKASREGVPTQQKTQMGPPPSLGRSASLRQPTASRSGVPGNQARSHTRNRSVQFEGKRLSGQLAPKQRDPTTTTTTTTPATSTSSAAKPAKLSFNTFQQHYSPKKQPKQPPPAATTTPITPEDPDSFLTASRPEVAALQTELLQLHLIHSSAIKTQSQWKASAEKQLRQRYKSVAAKYRSVIASDSAAQQNINIKALHELSENAKRSSGGRHDFTEQIQILSRTIQDVADLTDRRGGRYTALVKEFENWMERFNHSKGTQNSDHVGGGINNETADFTTPIGRNWQAEVSRLNSKLELCLRELQSLDVGVEGQQRVAGDENSHPSSLSALWRVVHGHTELLTSMIEELETISKIEAEVVKAERDRVREEVDRIVVDSSSHGSDNGKRKGVWKTG